MTKIETLTDRLQSQVVEMATFRGNVQASLATIAGGIRIAVPVLVTAVIAAIGTGFYLNTGVARLESVVSQVAKEQTELRKDLRELADAIRTRDDRIEGEIKALGGLIREARLGSAGGDAGRE